MDYQYTSQTPATLDPNVTAAFVIGFLIFMFLAVLVSYAVTVFFLGRIFKKAGVPQWAAWIPIYNNWKLLELGNQSGIWSILAYIPFVNLVSLIFTYIATYHIGLKLGKEKWFVLVAIFLPLIWLIWLAFDDSKWPKPKTAARPKKTSKTKKSS